jgi:hypothetical protein
MLAGSSGQAGGGYQISRSLRFNSADSAYLNRTPGSAGNRRTWTWAGWMKLSATGIQRVLNASSGGADDFIAFANDTLRFQITNSGGTPVGNLITTQVFRDYSSWYHIVVTLDTTQSTSSDRIKMYANGVQITSFSTATYPTQNTDALALNTAVAHYLSSVGGTIRYLNGYLADIHFIDGQALDPSSFGEFDDNGVWQPKAYEGTYGGVSVSAATGALPIFNTTGDYGLVKGTGARTDANASSLSLCVPMGTSAGLSLTDEQPTGRTSSSSTLTNTSVTNSTAVSKFYGGSASFNGTSSKLATTATSDFLFGTGDFTVEGWFYQTASNSYPSALEIGNHILTTGILFITSSGGNACIYSGGFFGVAPVQLNAWNHIAWTRTGGVLKIYVNGVLASSVAFTNNLTDTSNGVTIGTTHSTTPTGYYYQGYIQDFRVYKGLAKYTSNFSVVTPSNGFHLPFSDNSTAAALGTDTSGDGNDWTVNNITPSDGTTYSTGWALDSGSSWIGAGPSLSFNGLLGNNTVQTRINGGATWTAPSPIAFSSLRIWGFKAGANSFFVNGNDVSSQVVTGTVGTEQWNPIAGISSPLSTIRITGDISNTSGIGAVEVDGLILIDGASGDSLVDSPTNYGTDTGAGGQVRGNYATLNPLDKESTITLSNGNLDVSTTSGNWQGCKGAFGMQSGKWYWEYTATSGLYHIVSIVKPETPLGGYLVQNATAWGYQYTADKINNNVPAAYGASWGQGDTIGIALNLDAGTLVFYKNGVSQGTAYSGLPAGPYVPGLGLYPSSGGTFNFGQRPFAYTAPSGFKALCTTNLPEPTIADGSTAMDVALYTGNGSTQTISGLNFSPDLVWIKERSGSRFHALCDSVRGDGILLYSNSTFGEQDIGSTVVDLTSDGFNLGFNGGFTSVSHNWNAVTHAAWCWDAGSSTASNPDGSIPSQVRANASAGFSVVTYTGTGSSATVGHGLGVAPAMIITKGRTNTAAWLVYHQAIGATNFVQLNTTIASTASITAWNNTAPSSTVFSIGTSAAGNTSGVNNVAYCFAPVAGYSSFGSYTGNGSADGPFVYTGFRPRWVMIKWVTGANAWIIVDTARDSFNVQKLNLNPNDSDVENTAGTGGWFDGLSNGFKIRNGTDNVINASGGTYIYAAFAEHPFQYARAR